MTIESLVISYQQTRDSDTFSDIYAAAFEQKSHPVLRIRTRYGLDLHEAQAIVDDKIFEVVESYTEGAGSFLRILNTAIKYGAINEFKRDERERDRIGTTYVTIYDEQSGEGEGEAEIYEVLAVAPTTGEDEIFKEAQKNLDQRQLIETLLQNADETVYQTISAFIETDSYRQAAKLIGTCHKTVQARIRRLSKLFIEEKHGSPCDYYTTPTAKVS